MKEGTVEEQLNLFCPQCGMPLENGKCPKCGYCD
jgi:hypothetical protein